MSFQKALNSVAILLTIIFLFVGASLGALFFDLESDCSSAFNYYGCESTSLTAFLVDRHW